MNFDQADAFRIWWEGGYSDHADDRGGPTLYGISKAAHPEIDFDTLTPAGARLFFQDEYWGRYRCDLLPEPLDAVMYDAVVQHKARRAIRMLQRRIGANPDGFVGPKTAAAAERFPRVVQWFITDRVDYYDDLNDQPGQDTFSDGWFRRMVSLSMFCAARDSDAWRNL